MGRVNLSNRKVEDAALRAHKPDAASPEAVLRDLARLLEEYGPVWYTEDHYRRIRAALTPKPSRAHLAS